MSDTLSVLISALGNPQRPNNPVDKKGNVYTGMDTLFYNKKMIIGSESEIFEITKKEKEKNNA